MILSDPFAQVRAMITIWGGRSVDGRQCCGMVSGQALTTVVTLSVTGAHGVRPVPWQPSVASICGEDDLSTACHVPGLNHLAHPFLLQLADGVTLQAWSAVPPHPFCRVNRTVCHRPRISPVPRLLP